MTQDDGEPENESNDNKEKEGMKTKKYINLSNNWIFNIRVVKFAKFFDIKL